MVEHEMRMIVSLRVFLAVGEITALARNDVNNNKLTTARIQNLKFKIQNFQKWV